MPESRSKFQAQAYISKITTMCDQSIRVVVDTQEITNPEHEAMLFRLRHKTGWFLFAPAELKEEDVKDLPEVSVDKGDKTPAQRLRGTLYRQWENTNRVRTFEEYYRSRMEEIINKEKTKIDG